MVGVKTPATGGMGWMRGGKRYSFGKTGMKNQRRKIVRKNPLREEDKMNHSITPLEFPETSVRNSNLTTDRVSEGGGSSGLREILSPMIITPFFIVFKLCSKERISFLSVLSRSPSPDSLSSFPMNFEREWGKLRDEMLNCFYLVRITFPSFLFFSSLSLPPTPFPPISPSTDLFRAPHPRSSVLTPPGDFVTSSRKEKYIHITN